MCVWGFFYFGLLKNRICLHHIWGVSQPCVALNSLQTHYMTAIFEFVFLKVSICAHSMLDMYYRYYNLLVAFPELDAVCNYLKLA